MKPGQKRNPKIVGYGSGPHIYASELVNVFFDGTCVTICLGNLEARIAEKDVQPTEPPVINVSGKVTIPPATAATLVNTLSNILNALSGGQAPKGPHGPVMN